jgi:archaellin
MSANINPYDLLTFEIKTPVGATVIIQKTIPATIDPVMILH